MPFSIRVISSTNCTTVFNLLGFCFYIVNNQFPLPMLFFSTNNYFACRQDYTFYHLRHDSCLCVNGNSFRQLLRNRPHSFRLHFFRCPSYSMRCSYVLHQSPQSDLTYHNRPLRVPSTFFHHL